MKLIHFALPVTVLVAASLVTYAQTAPTTGRGGAGRRGGGGGGGGGGAPAEPPVAATVPATRNFELKGNPIWEDTFTADPAPVVFGDTLYVYTGHDSAKGSQQYTMHDWQCFSTKDLKTWTYHGVLLSALNKTDFKWSKGEAWASQVIEKGGKYYWFVTAQSASPNCKAIGVAVADSPTGPFKDAIGKPLVVDSMTPGGGWNDIDPTVWTEPDGSTYMFWGNGSCFYAKLKPNMIELDGAITTLPRLQSYVEGPWVFKRADKYYLVYASMRGGNETISYAMADKITGPWTFKSEIVGNATNSFTTHPGVIEFKGQWYMFYHNGAVKKPVDGGGSFRRSVCVDYMYFNDDGTIKPVVQTKEGITVPPKKD